MQDKPKLKQGDAVITPGGHEGRVSKITSGTRGWYVEVNLAPKGKPAEVKSFRASHLIVKGGPAKVTTAKPPKPVVAAKPAAKEPAKAAA